MTNVSKNSLELIENTGKSLKGKFGKAFLGTLILIAPIMACIFSVYLIPLAILLFGVLQTGYIRFIRDLIDDKQPSYKLILSEFTNPGLEILLGTLLICMFVLGGVVLIFPAIILIGIYSMSFYFAEKKKLTTPFDAMKQSRLHMKGNVTNMYSFKALYWVAYVILFVFGFTGVAIAYNLWADYKVLAIVVFAIDFIFTTLIWAVVSTYYNTSIELFFRELLVNDNVSKEETAEVKEETIQKEEPVQEAEEPVEEVKTEPVKKQPAKAPAKKTTGAKTTTTKSTATKSTAKSTTKPATTTTKPATKTTAKKSTSTKTTTKKTTE